MALLLCAPVFVVYTPILYSPRLWLTLCSWPPSQAFVSLPGSMSSSSGILDDYAGDPPPKIPHILLQAPQVEIVSTAVDKTTKTKDLILHTVKLTYRGIVWEVQFRRSEVRNLYGILQSLEMKNRGRKFRIGGSGKKGKTVKDELSFRYNERTVTDNGIDEQARADQESGGRGGGVFGTTSSGRQGSIMEGKIPKVSTHFHLLPIFFPSSSHLLAP